MEVVDWLVEVLLYVHRNFRLIRDGGARTATSSLTQLLSSECGGGGKGRLYTYRCTVTTRMTPALRWAATRAILMFH